jgi:gliding motility-associated-like protein
MKTLALATLILMSAFTNAQTMSDLEIISTPNNCTGDTINFSINTNLGIEQIIGWNFGDPNSGTNNASILLSPSHLYSNPGTYQVSCILQINCGGPVDINNSIGVPCFYIDTISIIVNIQECNDSNILEIISTPISCEFDTLNFSINTNLSIEQIISWNFGDSSSGTNNSSILLSPSHLYSNPGTYQVSCILQINCGGPVDINNPIGVPCFYIDTIYTIVNITECNSNTEECSLYVPNAFTPNNDELNEEFYPVSECTLDEYEWTVYDRWGNQIFYSINPDEKWNGKIKGADCMNGIYIYMINYKFPTQERKTKYGKILLVK